jgi:hypothetical protein
MPHTKVTGVTVSHIWDDLSVTDYDIDLNNDEEFGQFVTIKCQSDSIRIYKDSWHEIRYIINKLLHEDL